MCQTHREVAMGFTQEKFPAGTHMCLIYSDDTERRSIISRFLEAGLSSREKVDYFADTASPDEVRSWLVEPGVDPGRDGRGDQFSVSVAADTYCPRGKFLPEEMLDKLGRYGRQCAGEGYPSARVSGEMSWAVRGIPGSERLMEYEALVSDVLATHAVTAVCQYDANRFSGAVLLDVLKVHPMMIVHGQIVRNPYYMRPGLFLKDFRQRE